MKINNNFFLWDKKRAVSKNLPLLKKHDQSILIGNALDHFDTALFPFLAPFLGPVFFPDYNEKSQLMLSYSAFALPYLIRPFASFVFGFWANSYGPGLILSYSLIGVSVTTAFMAFIPGYLLIGPLAPFLLITLRLLNGFFAEGEVSLSRLYILEDKKQKDALKMSSYYQISSLLGIILASLLSSLCLYHPLAWRGCFLIGSLTAAFGLAIRKKEHKKKRDNNLKISIWAEKKKLINLAIVMGFSYVTYAVPFIFMRHLFPLKLSSLSTSFLLLFDLFLLLVFGKFVNQWNVKKILLFSSLILGVSSFPLFFFIPYFPPLYTVFVQCWVIFFGVLFTIPLNVWAKNYSGGSYLLSSFGGGVGTATIGRLTPIVCLWVWEITASTAYTSLYLVFFSILAASILYKNTDFEGNN